MQKQESGANMIDTQYSKAIAFLIQFIRYPEEGQKEKINEAISCISEVWEIVGHDETEDIENLNKIKAIALSRFPKKEDREWACRFLQSIQKM